MVIESAETYKKRFFLLILVTSIRYVDNQILKHTLHVVFYETNLIEQFLVYIYECMCTHSYIYIYIYKI